MALLKECDVHTTTCSTAPAERGQGVDGLLGSKGPVSKFVPLLLLKEMSLRCQVWVAA